MSKIVALDRERESLRHALGPVVAEALADELVTDVLLNADGRVWVDMLGVGRQWTGETLPPDRAEHALRQLANFCGVPLTRQAPVLSATMPGLGERVAGTIPPITSAPTFAIRVPPRTVFGLEAFEGRGAESFSQEATVRRIEEAGTNMGLLRRAVEERRNILIAGAIGSGKTSLLSALMQLDGVRRDRVLALEDTRELALDGIDDHVRLLTSSEVDMRALVQLSLRYRPDRILIGEMRSGSAALEWLHSCNTGASGSLATIHANSCEDALGRVADLCSEVTVQTPDRAIKTAIGAVVFVVRTATGRAIKEVVLTHNSHHTS